MATGTVTVLNPGPIKAHNSRSFCGRSWTLVVVSFVVNMGRVVGIVRRSSISIVVCAAATGLRYESRASSENRMGHVLVQSLQLGR